MERMITTHELTFEVLKAVAKPLSSLRTFKNDILAALSKGFPDCDCQFASYAETDDALDRFIMSDIVTMGMPDMFSSEQWIEKYFSTYIFNPNRCLAISRSERNIFRVSDLMSPSEYEQCRNYRECMVPNGYYYPMAAMLKYDGAFIGQLTLLRRKEEGEFTEEEMRRLEEICPYICSRLRDYVTYGCYLVHINTYNEPAEEPTDADDYLSKLSPRQREIVTLFAAGMTTREIAEQLVISEHTVRKHIENIRVLLGVKNRISALKKLHLL